MKLSRRNLVHHAALGASAAFLGASPAARPQAAAASDSESSDGLTHYVAGFIVNTGYSDVPPEVVDLGKKSILDGLGLMFSGSVAPLGELGRTYVRSLGLAASGATVVGTSMKVSPRFAAFLNGLAMHADDSADDRQRRDRLSHPRTADCREKPRPDASWT